MPVRKRLLPYIDFNNKHSVYYTVLCIHKQQFMCADALMRCVIRPFCIRTWGIQTSSNDSFPDSKLAISVGSIFNDIHCTLPSVYMDQNCFCFCDRIKESFCIYLSN